MSDIEKNLRSESRLEFLTESGFWDKNINVRFGIFFLFILTTFLVLHFRDIKMDHYELDTEAKRYAVAQINFEFHDEEATLISKQEALRDLGFLFTIDEKLLERRRRDVKRFLRDQDSWRYALTKSSFEELYTAVNLIFDACRHTLYTDNKTYLKMQKLGLDTERIYILDGVNDHENFRIPQKVWDDIMRTAFEGRRIPFEAQRFALEYFEDEPWHFEVDVSAQRQLKEQILSQVPQKYVRMKAGSRIIDQGERVTERHLTIFKAMKEALKNQAQRGDPLSILGSLLLATVLISLMAVAFCYYYRDIFSSNRQLLLIFVIYAVALSFSEVVEKLILDSTISGLDIVDSALFVPLITLLMSSLFPIGASILVSVLSLVVMTFSLPVHGEHFALMNFVGLLVTLVSRQELQHRRYVFYTCAKIWLSCSLLYLGLYFYEHTMFDMNLWQDALFLLACMIVSAITVIILLPVLENLFHVMTDMTLMDYLDPNKDLLRRLSIEAPGTYQHSLLVAHLAEGAASAIGARSLFSRVSAFYHDIGKLAFPHYFVENQQGVNVHQLLTPLESAQVIIAHISEGVTLARKYGLPEPFVDIIKEHHGTSLVHYFYKKALEHEGSQINEKDFRYCGPKPRSKEAVIVMLADCLEAASRSLDEFTEPKVHELMEDIVQHKIADNQLDQSSLTMSELSTVKKCLVKTLIAASHSRIKYPSLNVLDPNIPGIGAEE